MPDLPSVPSLRDRQRDAWQELKDEGLHSITHCMQWARQGGRRNRTRILAAIAIAIPDQHGKILHLAGIDRT
jgi:hypothetical protein